MSIPYEYNNLTVSNLPLCIINLCLLAKAKATNSLNLSISLLLENPKVPIILGLLSSFKIDMMKTMTEDFDRMNEVIDTLEVGKLLLSEREVIQTRGGKSKAENFTILGQQIHNILTKKGKV